MRISDINVQRYAKIKENDSQANLLYFYLLKGNHNR